MKLGQAIAAIWNVIVAVLFIVMLLGWAIIPFAASILAGWIPG